MRALAFTMTLLLAVGCEREVPPPIPRVDAGYGDAGGFDARVVRRDAGPPGPAIDGVIDEDEWAEATSVESSVETDREGSALARLSALIDHDRLFVAVEGTIAAGDSIVIYVDRDYGGEDGLADPSELADIDGALDAAITQPSLDLTGFAMDLAWGTQQMPHDGRLDGAIGWRDVATDPAAFALVADEVRNACGDGACETSIPLDVLGGSAPRTIALFARVVRADGGLTNQTLPEDDATRPALVRALLIVEEAAPIPDAGMPDGGVDAGTGGIVIDGVIDEPEWALATVHANDVSAGGAFAGNALRTVRALRDETQLYVAIEATLTSGNAILMYVDHDLGGEDGLVFSTMDLGDPAGALDRALSKALLTPVLRIDAAWGTTRMSHASSDETMGWRDVATNTSDFGVLSGASACSASACETSIALSALGSTPDESVALAVRLGSAINLAMSNQTLPLDVDPDSIEAYVTLAP